METKLENKKRLARYVLRKVGLGIDPITLFDVHAKRIHEYKRQLLKLLHVVTLYNRIKANPGASVVARTVLFAGKAAPAYHQAKRIIKLVNSVAERVNSDPDVRGRLRVVFLPNYCVSQAEKLVPAADLSEQISTAGMEASGTGNMKMGLNGALTIGTLDGANVEIMEAVGRDNIFLFGLKAGDVAAQRSRGHDPRQLYRDDAELRAALDLIASDYFTHGEPGLQSLKIAGNGVCEVISSASSGLEYMAVIGVLWASPYLLFGEERVALMPYPIRRSYELSFRAEGYVPSVRVLEVNENQA